jgi:hypothetical protein
MDKCSPYLKDGQKCSSAYECATSDCRGGVCSGLTQDRPCQHDNECKPGLVCIFSGWDTVKKCTKG